MRRVWQSCALLVLLLLCVLAGQQGSVHSAAPNQANQQVEQLKKQLAEKTKDLTAAQAAIQKLQNELKKEKGDDTVFKKQLAEKEAEIKKLSEALKKEKGGVDDKLIAQLRKELDSTKLSVKEKDARIAQLAAGVPGAADTIKHLDKLNETVRKLEATTKAPYVHTVVFKMTQSSDEAKVKALIADAGKMLTKVEAVRGYWIGKPAAEATPEVAAKDYQVALVVLFDDSTGLKSYLEHPEHKKFAESLGKDWAKPVVYDFLRDK